MGSRGHGVLAERSCTRRGCFGHADLEERIIAEDRQYRSLEAEEEKGSEVRENVRKWAVAADKMFAVGLVEQDEGIAEWAQECWTGRGLGELISERRAALT